MRAHSDDVIAGKADAFRLSAILGFAMAAYCLTLPHTPPTRGARKNAVFEALGEVRRQPLVTLFLLAVPVSCIHQFYFVHTESFLGAKQASQPAWFKTIFGEGGGGLMTIGQMSEIFVLGLIPLIARTWSRKTLLAIGLCAYAARMALFAYVDAIGLPPMATLVLGIALHGLCFGCFIFVAFMVVDENTSSDVRASAQNLFNLVIIGVGVIVGSKIAGWAAEYSTVSTLDADAHISTAVDYTRLFSLPMWAALVCLGLLLLFYPSRKRAAVAAAVA
jgi:hypothetical protein